MTHRIAEVRPIHARIGNRNQLLLKITLEDGTYGWGQSGLNGRELAVKGMLEHFAPILIGQTPFAIGRIWQELYRSQYMEGGIVLGAAVSAVDIALHDIKANASACRCSNCWAGGSGIPCPASPPPRASQTR